MENGVFSPADVEIYRHPVPLSLLLDRTAVKFRADVSQIVPAGDRPLRLGIGLTNRLLPCLRIGGLQPVSGYGQRGLSGLGRQKVIYLRKCNRGRALGQRARIAVYMDH